MASHRHKRENPHPKPAAVLLAGTLAALATGGAVTLGVMQSDTQARNAAESNPLADSTPQPQDRSDRQAPTVSRAGRRPVIVERPILKPLSAVEQLLQPDAVTEALANARDERWTTEDLNLWTRPDDDAEQVGIIEAGKKVLITGRQFGQREEIVFRGEARWVTVDYLSSERPEPEPVVAGECSNGTSVDPGVSENIVMIHQAVCANWPQITTYGTLRGGGGDHSLGKAVDIMISGETGWQVAEFVRANAARFGVNYVIFSQRIWSVERSGEGWRGMEDRGSVTANHYDHVHVSVY